MVGKPSREVSRRSFMQVVSGSVIGGFVLSWFPEVARAVEPGKSPGRPWYLEEGSVSDEVAESNIGILRNASTTKVNTPLTEYPDVPVEFFSTRKVSGGRSILTRSIAVSDIFVEVTFLEVLASGMVARQHHEGWFVDEVNKTISLVGKGVSAQLLDNSVTPMVSCGSGYYECYECSQIDWSKAWACCGACKLVVWPAQLAIACLLAKCVYCYNTSCVAWAWGCCEHYT